MRRHIVRGSKPYRLLFYLVSLVLLGLIINSLLSRLESRVAPVTRRIETIPGLIVYYPLNQSSATELRDAGPHHVNGACFGVRPDQSGLVGPSFSFDGSYSYCSVPDNALLSPTEGFTVLALVELRELNRLNGLLGKSAYNLSGFRLYTNASSKLLFDVITVSGEQLLTSRNNFPAVNHWVFLAVTYNRYNQIIYVNGHEFQAQIGNSALDELSRYNDKFSDVNGMRAYPWGFEPQLGRTTNVFNGNGTISMSSDSNNNATLFALPDLTRDKPIVFAGKNYTQSFELKYNITSGHGIRLIHQWFDSTDPSTEPFQSDYGQFLTGASRWKTISLTKTAPPGAIRGDIVLELWGTGTVQARNPEFYLTNAADAAVTTNTQPLLLGQVTGNGWRMNGSMQHVALLNRAMSKGEVLSLATIFGPSAT